MSDWLLEALHSDEATALEHGTADEIERLLERCKKLQAENERLRAALREIANDPVGISIVQAEIARAALTGEQP